MTSDEASETPEVDKLMLMLNDPMTKGIIENVLTGDMMMNWNNGEPTFQVSEQGMDKVASMLKDN